MTALATFTYNRTHSVTFVADSMRTALIRLIDALGLRPDALINDWKLFGPAVSALLQTGDLFAVTLEFYVPGSTVAAARWDIPVSYDGSGVADDMWLDREHLARTIAKSPRPPAGALYRIVLITAPGCHVAGMEETEFRSLGSMTSRAAGTVIASPAITAGLSYWK